MKAVLIAALAAATPALGQSPMTAAEFDDYVTGKTLTFSSLGVDYGQEEYRDDRRVRWSFLDGDCKEGRWYPDAENICFVYEDGTGPQCWRFFRDAAGLRAHFVGDPPGSVLYETRASREPLACLGPEVGV